MKLEMFVSCCCWSWRHNSSNKYLLVAVLEQWRERAADATSQWIREMKLYFLIVSWQGCCKAQRNTLQVCAKTAEVRALFCLPFAPLPSMFVYVAQPHPQPNRHRSAALYGRLTAEERDRGHGHRVFTEFKLWLLLAACRTVLPKSWHQKLPKNS